MPKEADKDKDTSTRKATPEDSTPGGLALKQVGEPKDDASTDDAAAHSAKFTDAYLKARRG